MADTQRTKSQLETLFADNVTGDISPQDLRDFMTTVMNRISGYHNGTLPPQGTDQSTAIGVNPGTTDITSPNGVAGVQLPNITNAPEGTVVELVVGDGAGNLLVYPATDEVISTAGLNGSVTVQKQHVCIFKRHQSIWYHTSLTP